MIISVLTLHRIPPTTIRVQRKLISQKMIRLTWYSNDLQHKTSPSMPLGEKRSNPPPSDNIDDIPMKPPATASIALSSAAEKLVTPSLAVTTTMMTIDSVKIIKTTKRVWQCYVWQVLVDMSQMCSQNLMLFLFYCLDLKAFNSPTVAATELWLYSGPCKKLQPISWTQNRLSSSNELNL